MNYENNKDETLPSWMEQTGKRSPTPLQYLDLSRKMNYENSEDETLPIWMGQMGKRFPTPLQFYLLELHCDGATPPKRPRWTDWKDRDMQQVIYQFRHLEEWRKMDEDATCCHAKPTRRNTSSNNCTTIDNGCNTSIYNHPEIKIQEEGRQLIAGTDELSNFKGYKIPILKNVSNLKNHFPFCKECENVFYYRNSGNKKIYQHIYECKCVIFKN